MKFNFFLLCISMTLTFAMCKSDPAIDEKKVEQILGDGKDYQDLIRNPITADNSGDTTNVAVAGFEEVRHDFGELKAGAIVSHTFKFTNTGKVPLIIKDATSTCGCTVPDFPEDPIEPGGKGEIRVKFNTENKEGYQNKPVTVFTNGYPARYTLMVTAKVNK